MSDNKPLSRAAADQQQLQQAQQQQRAALPAVDVFEDRSGITLLADMPGVPESSWS